MQKTFISAISLQAPGYLKKFTYHPEWHPEVEAAILSRFFRLIFLPETVRMDLNSKTIGRQVFRLCQSLQNIWGSERKMFV